MVDVPDHLKPDILALEGSVPVKISQMLSWFAQTTQEESSFFGTPFKNIYLPIVGEEHNRTNTPGNIYYLCTEHVANVLGQG